MPTTNQLLTRKRAIERKRIQIRGVIREVERKYEKSGMQRFINNSSALKDSDALLEAEHRFITTTLYGRMLTTGLEKPDLGNRKMFISHSRKDKPFVRQVADDLKIRGHCFWFDETRIRAGDSIPREIQNGLKDSSYVIVFLSKNAVASNWVEVEWVGKFWEEVSGGKKVVIPALIEECEIPFFLKTKKYADFSASYETALSDLIKAIA